MARRGGTRLSPPTAKVVLPAVRGAAACSGMAIAPQPPPPPAHSSSSSPPPKPRRSNSSSNTKAKRISSAEKHRKGKGKAKTAGRVLAKHTDLQEIDLLFAQVTNSTFVDDAIDRKLRQAVAVGEDNRRTQGAAIRRGRKAAVYTGTSPPAATLDSSWPAAASAASAPPISSALPKSRYYTQDVLSTKDERSRAELMRLIQDRIMDGNASRVTRQIADTAKMQMQASENEKILASKKVAVNWQANAVGSRLLREFGPFPLPTKQIAVEAVLEVITGKDPFEATFLFCIGVLRLVTLKTGRGSGKERGHSCKLLKAGLSSAHHVHDDVTSGSHSSRVRPTTLRLVESIHHELIESYFKGIDPTILSPLNSYHIDTDNLILQFEVGAETIRNIEGSTCVVKVVCNGAHPGMPKTRPMQLRCENGLWKVERFVEFLLPVVPGFNLTTGGSVEEMAREKRYREAMGVVLESGLVLTPSGEMFEHHRKERRGTMVKAPRKTSLFGDQLSRLARAFVHDRPDSKRICECFSLRKALDPDSPHDDRFDFGWAEAAEQFQRASIVTSKRGKILASDRTEYSQLPLPPRDVHSFLATCQRQALPTGVYMYWPRGPAGKSAAIRTDKSWVFEPADIGCGVLLKFRMKGTDLVLGESGGLTIPYDAGVPIKRSSNRSYRHPHIHGQHDDCGTNTTPTDMNGAGTSNATAGAGAGDNDGFIVLQGVLTGMWKTTHVQESQMSLTSEAAKILKKGKSGGLNRMKRIANSVSAFHALEMNATYGDESTAAGNYAHGWQVEVEISLGTCSESNCLDHFGIGKKTVVPGRSIEQNELLVRDGPFGSGKPFAGKKSGRFHAPPHFISPATAPTPAYVCKLGTKIVVKERGPLYGYCATIVGHSGMRTLVEIRDSKGPYLCANRPFAVEFDNTTADDKTLDTGIDYAASQFALKIGNHNLRDLWNEYRSGDLLIVVDGNFRWVEVKVKHHTKFSRYTLRRKIPVDIDGHDLMDMDLNDANHFCPLLSIQQYENEVKRYLKRHRKTYSNIIDKITLDSHAADAVFVGLKLAHADLLRPHRGDLGDVGSVKDLCETMAIPENTHRRCGCHSTHPTIIRGESGSGKTWACEQMAYVLSCVDSNGDFPQQSLSYRYVPLVLSVHKLARLLKLEHSQTCKPAEVMELYCEVEAGSEKIFNMLMDAYASQRLFIIIDGLDDVPHLASLMQRLIFDVLLPGQHKLVACSKAVGVDSELYRVGFAIYDMQPFTVSQQKRVCTSFLDGDAVDFASNMFEFLRNRDEQDAIIKPLRCKPDLTKLEELGSFERPHLVTRWIERGLPGQEEEHDWDDNSFEALAKALAAKAGSGKTMVNNKAVLDLRQVSVVRSEMYRANKFEGDVDDAIDDVPAVMTIVSTVEELMEGAMLARSALGEIFKKVSKQYRLPIFNGRGSQRPDGSPAILVHHIDPMSRIHSIAEERYSAEVSAGLREGPAIAWTTDAVRATVVCDSPQMMFSLATQFQSMPGLAVVQATNYFSDLDPLHYRRLALVLKVDVGEGTRHFAEVEMQLVEVYENIPTLAPYTYFENMFGAQIVRAAAMYAEPDGWTWLTREMKKWRALLQTPIILALMIVILRDFNYLQLKIDQVPTTNAGVYQQATAAIVRRGLDMSTARLESIVLEGDHDAKRSGRNSTLRAQSFMSNNPGSYHFPHSEDADASSGGSRGASSDDDGGDSDSSDGSVNIENGGKPQRKTSVMMAKVKSKKKKIKHFHVQKKKTTARPVLEITKKEAEVLLNDIPDPGRIIQALGVLAHANHLHRGTVRSVFMLKGSFKYFDDHTELLDTLKWFSRVGGSQHHLPGCVAVGDVDPDEDVSQLKGDAVWLTQLYECAHASIQQHLCSEHLSRTLHKGTHVKSALRGEGGLSSFVNGPRHYALFNLAEGGLARGLFGHAGRAYLQNIGINRHGLRNLFSGSWLKRLKVLNLSHNGLSAASGPLIEQAVREYFADLNSLMVVGNNFTFSTRVALLQWARKDRKRRIEVDGGNEKLEAALRARDNDPSIVHLDLSSCKMCETDSEWLTKVLGRSNTVRSAHLWSNQLGPKCGAALATLLVGNTSLNELILYNNFISGTGAVAIAKAVAENKSLVKLDLERNTLGEDAGVHLATSLLRNRVLSVIHLQRTMLGERTTLLLADVLVLPSCCISDLKLDWNSLGNRAVSAIGAAIKENRSLRHLSLRAVGMDNQAASTIARALAINTTLATLQLGNNHLGEKAGLAFAGTLVVNSTLIKLVLANNTLGDAAGLAIAKAIGMNQSPRRIDVENNGFSKKTKGELGKTKKKYPACKIRF